VERDPKFVLAYCELAKAHDILYLTRQVTPVEIGRLITALGRGRFGKRRGGFSPTLAQCISLLAHHFLWAKTDLLQARVEIDLARRTMPNSAELETTAAAIARRQSRWDDTVRAQERAVALEPRAVKNLFFLADTYRLLRRYDRFDDVMASCSEYCRQIAQRPTGSSALSVRWRVKGTSVHCVQPSQPLYTRGGPDQRFV